MEAIDFVNVKFGGGGWLMTVKGTVWLKYTR